MFLKGHKKNNWYVVGDTFQLSHGVNESYKVLMDRVQKLMALLRELRETFVKDQSVRFWSLGWGRLDKKNAWQSKGPDPRQCHVTPRNSMMIRDYQPLVSLRPAISCGVALWGPP